MDESENVVPEAPGGDTSVAGSGVGDAPVSPVAPVESGQSSQLPTAPPLPEAPATPAEPSPEPAEQPAPTPGQPVSNPALEQAMANATNTPAPPTEPVQSSGGVEAMVLLDGLYNDATALLRRVEASGLANVHSDVTELVTTLNTARTWLATKLAVYNPEHAALLHDIPGAGSV